MGDKLSVIRDLKYIKLNDDQVDILSDNIADYFKEMSNTSDNVSREGFIDLTNLYLYEHGLIENKGLKDYVLTDFLESNQYLISDRKVPTYLFETSLMDLRLGSDLSLLDYTDNEYFDIFKEFVVLNVLSINNEKLSKEVLKKTGIQVDRKFLRILSYYSALYCVHLTILMDREEDVDQRLVLDEKMKDMFDLYEDFTIFTPNWFK